MSQHSAEPKSPQTITWAELQALKGERRYWQTRAADLTDRLETLASEMQALRAELNRVNNDGEATVTDERGEGLSSP